MIHAKQSSAQLVLERVETRQRRAQRTLEHMHTDVRRTLRSVDDKTQMTLHAVQTLQLDLRSSRKVGRRPLGSEQYLTLTSWYAQIDVNEIMLVSVVLFGSVLEAA